MRFHNKVAVVFGGNSGIGLAAAKGFAREGAQVVITGRDEKTLAEAAQEIGGDVLALQSDIADLEQIDKVIAAIKAKHNRIDILSVNAGIGAFKPFETVDEAHWDTMMGINLKGHFFVTQKAVPLMPAGSAIVYTSSIGHLKGLPGNSVYAASKAGLRALAQNIGVELVDRGIRVNCFSPGPIDTPIIHRSSLTAEEVPAFKAAIEKKIPMKRFGTPEEAANAILFLASDDASFIAGIDLIADGGVINF